MAWSIGKRSKQLYYPDWLEGTWQAEASLDKVSTGDGAACQPGESHQQC